jgi:DHA2 family multidrug resistance protein
VIASHADQAYLLSSIEIFWICGWLSFAMIGLMWLASRPDAHEGPIAAD